jgi:hypothetical protein
VRDHAFEASSGIEEIDLENSVTGIGQSSFAGCSGTCSAKFVSRLENIGAHSSLCR